jgi:hypothetical protein
MLKIESLAIDEWPSTLTTTYSLELGRGNSIMNVHIDVPPSDGEVLWQPKGLTQLFCSEAKHLISQEAKP